MKPGRAQVAATALALLSLVAAQTLVLFGAPPEPAVAHADALVILSPSARLHTTVDDLIGAGLAEALIVVHWPEATADSLSGCGHPEVRPVHCVAVDPVGTPGGTRAQVIAATQIAREHGYRSLIIVVRSYKTVRTRLLAGRCHDGPVTVVPVTDRDVDEILREWPALLYALARPGC